MRSAHIYCVNKIFAKNLVKVNRKINLPGSALDLRSKIIKEIRLFNLFSYLFKEIH